MIEQVKDIPWASIWSLVLAIGGLILVLFFSSIGFLPDLDIEALAGVIASIAIVGLYFLIMLGTGFILPTLFIKLDAPAHKAIHKATVLLEAFLGIAIGGGLVLNAAYPTHCSAIYGILIGVLPILLCYGIAFWKVRPEYISRGSKSVAKVFAWGFWSLMIPMFSYVQLTERKETEWIDIVIFLLFPVAFAVVSILIACQPVKKQLILRPIAAIVSVIALSFFVSRPALVSHAAVAILGLSVDQKDVAVVLSEAGCNAANAMLGQQACVVDKDAKLGALHKARIVSRIGSQMVVRWQPVPAKAAGDAVEQAWRRAIFKKEDVIGWAYDEAVPKKPPDTSKPSAGQKKN
jgi:hypothetical protein